MGSPIIGSCWTVNGKPVYSGVTRRMPLGRQGIQCTEGLPYAPFSAGGCRQLGIRERPGRIPGDFCLRAHAETALRAGSIYIRARRRVPSGSGRQQDGNAPGVVDARRRRAWRRTTPIDLRRKGAGSWESRWVDLALGYPVRGRDRPLRR
jgi:hypothetical protein